MRGKSHPCVDEMAKHFQKRPASARALRQKKLQVQSGEASVAGIW